MTLRTRISLCFLTLIAIGFYSFVSWLLDDIRPRLLGSIEESLVDTSTVLAAVLSEEIDEGVLDVALFEGAMSRVGELLNPARIYDFLKEDVDLRVYVTDKSGRVLFDSDGGHDVGADYSNWNDVHLTLRGQYGARSTRSDPDDPYTSTMVVAAPIVHRGEIVGVLSVAKPTKNPNLFIVEAKRQTIIAGIAAGVSLALLTIAVTLWITRPIERLTHYARSVRDGKRVPLPRLGSSEIGTMGEAMEEMRESLEGKESIERFAQALTHEIKGPVAAIQGAAELLNEDMGEERRQKFVNNIAIESRRVEELVDRLLLLASVENRDAPRDEEALSLQNLLEDILEELRSRVEEKDVQVDLRFEGHGALRGESLLVRQALKNIVQNALDFVPSGGRLTVRQTSGEGKAQVRVHDSGPGIPDYALSRVLERFYSLPRPDSGKKSSGLGLSFVKEVAELHGGSLDVRNAPDGGAEVTVCFGLAT